MHSYLQLFCVAVLLWLGFICSRLQRGATISQPKPNHDVWTESFFFKFFFFPKYFKWMYLDHTQPETCIGYLKFVDVTCTARHCASQLCMAFLFDNIGENLVVDFESNRILVGHKWLLRFLLLMMGNAFSWCPETGMKLVYFVVKGPQKINVENFILIKHQNESLYMEKWVSTWWV